MLCSTLGYPIFDLSLLAFTGSAHAHRHNGAAIVFDTAKIAAGRHALSDRSLFLFHLRLNLTSAFWVNTFSYGSLPHETGAAIGVW